MMPRLLVAIISLVLWGSSAHSQPAPDMLDDFAAGLEDFMPEEPEKPLGELIDDFALPDESAAGDSTETDASPIAGSTADQPDRESTVGEGATAPAAEMPDGWERHEKLGISFATPSDWHVLEDDGDELVVASGPKEERRGIAVAVSQGRAREFDDAPPGARVSDAPDVQLGPSPFRHRRLEVEIGDVQASAHLLMSPGAVEDDEHVFVFVTAADVDPSEATPVIEAILASMRHTPPPAPATEDKGALGGLVKYRLPGGWKTLSERSDAVFLRTIPLYSAYFAVLKGEQAQEAARLQDFEMPPDRQEGEEILGQKADLYEGMTREAELQNFATMVRGMKRIYLLKTCLDDRAPIAVSVAGTPDWWQGDGFETISSAVELTLPESARPCGPALAATEARGDGSATGTRAEPIDASASDMAAAPGVEGRSVRFPGTTTGGWTGQYATLSNPGSGGPDGGGYLKAFTPGDGRTAYFRAPASLLGDWRRMSSLRVVLMTGTGEYVAPYEYGGRGDVFIANGEMTASAVFDRRIGEGWNTRELSFSDPSAWRLSGGAQSLADVLANVTAFEIRAEYLTGDAEAGLASVELVPGDASDETAGPVPGDALATNWVTYHNPRYGTAVDYPADLFQALPPPENGDGRRFASPTGRAKFMVFASHNVMGKSLDDLVLDQVTSGTYDAILNTSIDNGRARISGVREGMGVIHLDIIDENDVIHTLEASYDRGEETTLKPVFERMVSSFRVGAAPPALDQPTTGTSSGDNGGAMELAFWQSIADSPDPADFEAYLAQWPNGTFAALAANRLKSLGAAAAAGSPSIEKGNSPPAGYTTPARSSDERAAIMDAARVPVARDIGQRVIFVVSVLRTDGEWAYLQAEPRQPDGTKLDWTRTPFARDWRADMMSEVVMVLLRKERGRWKAIDYVIGPTDVAWYDWVGRYGLPETLFHGE